MNKQQAQQRIEAAERELAAAKEALKECEEIIYVPDSIDFRFYGTSVANRIALVFNDSKNELSYDDANGGIPYVGYAGFESNKDYGKGATKFKLVKVDKPEAGNWYLCFLDITSIQATKLPKYRYKLFTTSEEYWEVQDDCSIRRYRNYKWRNYYQVVPC